MFMLIWILLFMIGSINSFRSNCLILRFKNEQINNRCHDAIQMISGDDDNQAISSSTQHQLSSSSPLSSNVNVKLDNVKNMRDISTVRTSSSYIKPNKVIRTGCVSRASENDIKRMKELFDFKTFVDLRSPAEIEEDEHLMDKVYNNFLSFEYKPTQKKFIENLSINVNITTTTTKTTTTAVGTTDSELTTTSSNYKRFFISLMSESLIKKGVFFRLRKRLRFKAIGLFLLSKISRRANKKVRSIFLDKINTGGLALLNELVVDTSGAEIIEVMKLATNPNNFPIALYCTAGKDRTGLVTMLLLSVLGVSDEEIVADYVLSDNAYKEIGDKKAMVASLKQVDVDPDTFLRAKPEVMKATMQYIRNKYGSINNYLDKNGYDATWREQLKTHLLETVTSS